MKKTIVILLSVFWFAGSGAQNPGTISSGDPAKAGTSGQEIRLTASIKASTRLFGAKNDLTTVILVIPKGSEVNVIGSDSTYLHVIFEENDGYILRRHAAINEPVEVPETVVQKTEPVRESNPEVNQERQVSRFTYLEEKYGTSMASKLIAGKIWKGMNAAMIRDSWGKPQKINRVISGNTVKEEWLYRNSWLYLENDVLEEWGPIKK